MNMKLITLNFGTWNNSAKGGRLRKIYQRIYIKGYKWTPFVMVKFKLLSKDTLNKNKKKMKKLIMIILILISIQGYTQNLLGYTKKDIISSKGNPTSTDITNDSVTFISYVYSGSHLEEGYRFNRNICYTYYVMNTNNLLNHYINILNENYIRIDTNIWIYKFEDFTSIAEIKFNIVENRFLLSFFRDYND